MFLQNARKSQLACTSLVVGLKSGLNGKWCYVERAGLRTSLALFLVRYSLNVNLCSLFAFIAKLCSDGSYSGLLLGGNWLQKL